MKQLFFILSLVSLSSVSICCNAKKGIDDVKKTLKTITSVSNKKEIKYKLIISFISKGAGKDSHIHDSIISYISTHPKKPISKIIFWGREGETDYCFLLKELKKDEQIEFINNIKKIIGTSDMVLLLENAIPPHKGR